MRARPPLVLRSLAREMREQGVLWHPSPGLASCTRSRSASAEERVGALCLRRQPRAQTGSGAGASPPCLCPWPAFSTPRAGAHQIPFLHLPSAEASGQPLENLGWPLPQRGMVPAVPTTPASHTGTTTTHWPATPPLLQHKG